MGMNKFISGKSAASARTGRHNSSTAGSQRKERSRQLAEAVARALAAGQASETHPERGTGFASAAMKWSDSFMRESMKKNPEWMRKHAQAPLMRSLCPEHRTHKGSRGQ